MSNKTPQEVGKEIEQQFQDMCKEFMNAKRFSFERLYDTHSAGSYMPTMPCDFIVGYEGVTHFIEIKSSEKYNSLSDGSALRSLIKDGPSAKLKLWIRAGVPCHFVFVSQIRRSVEWYDAKEVLPIYYTPRARLPPPLMHYVGMDGLKQNFLHKLHDVNRKLFEDAYNV